MTSIEWKRLKLRDAAKRTAACTLLVSARCAQSRRMLCACKGCSGEVACERESETDLDQLQALRCYTNFRLGVVGECTHKEDSGCVRPLCRSWVGLCGSGAASKSKPHTEFNIHSYVPKLAQRERGTGLLLHLERQGNLRTKQQN